MPALQTKNVLTELFVNIKLRFFFFTSDSNFDGKKRNFKNPILKVLFARGPIGDDGGEAVGLGGLVVLVRRNVVPRLLTRISPTNRRAGPRFVPDALRRLDAESVGAAATGRRGRRLVDFAEVRLDDVIGGRHVLQLRLVVVVVEEGRRRRRDFDFRRPGFARGRRTGSRLRDHYSGIFRRCDGICRRRIRRNC